MEQLPQRSTGNLVQAVSWDLGGITGLLGRRILGVYHIGLSVYGYLYEFTDTGIRKTCDKPQTIMGNPGSTCIVGEFLGREKLGTTSVSLEEFDTWVATQKELEYTSESYCVSKHNCAHFVLVACSRLGVAVPQDANRLCNWTEENTTALRTVNKIFGTMSSIQNPFSFSASTEK